jgi:ribose transport system ATP-binding protein
MNDNILEIRNLKKTYPGVIALNDVSFSVRRGEVHALIGENGAGKSTLIKSITGAIIPDSGTIRFDGKDYSHLDPRQSSKLGIGVIYQEFTLVPALSVAENIFLGNYSGSSLLVDFNDMNERARQALQRIGVDIPVQKPVYELTVGYQQIVEITRSLVHNAKLLIMDEPTAPLTKNEVEQLTNIVQSMKEQGITIIYISHRLEEVFKLADRVSIMRDGSYITTLDVQNTNMQEMIKLMVGRELTESFPPREHPLGEEVLRVENLSGNGIQNISFSLHKGEILGFAGLLGCGRTETMQMLYGVAKKTQGSVYLRNRPLDIQTTSQALKEKIGLIPEDRKRNGVFLSMPIVWNTSISCIKQKLMKWGLIVDKEKERNLAEDYKDKLQIKTPSIDQLVQNLSGGNQQKVAVSKVLAIDPEIMIFDEPTRGIDVGAKQEMYNLIRSMVNEGKAVLLISSEMEEVIGLSDRIVVLHEGKLMKILEPHEFDQEYILTLASGISA